ncbi:hypothetical protein, partial [Xanthomonas hortorum]|uniref:hypothetical protein n=1 Tax=Xanthomonas hortorum TaxID=56454 RepID=UPI0020443291
GWSVRMVQAMHDGRCPDNGAFGHLPNTGRAMDKLLRKQPTNFLVRCPYRLRDRVAAWMPPPSLHGRIYGVSRER